MKLPFPKDKVYPVEKLGAYWLIIPFEVNETVDEWLSTYKTTIFMWDELANLKVKVSEPKVDGEQLPESSIAGVLLIN